jgi:hypothetical protein
MKSGFPRPAAEKSKETGNEKISVHNMDPPEL